MSDRAQQKLEQVINTRCQPAASHASFLKAEVIETQESELDQGHVDVTYTVEVNFHNLQNHKNEKAIVVLTDFAGSNPSIDWVELKLIQMSAKGLCK